MGKMSLNYEDCSSVIRSLTAAINNAEKDLENLELALELTTGCCGDSSLSVKSAIIEIENAVEGFIKFKKNFGDLVKDIKEYDDSFRSSFNTFENYINDIVSNSVSVIMSSANKNTFSNGYIEILPSGKTKVVGKKLNSLQIHSTVVKDFGQSTFATEPDYRIGNATKGLSYTIMVDDIADNRYRNKVSEKLKSKVTADVVKDVTIDLGGMAVATACAEVGATIGTAIPIPVVGTIAGTVLGFSAGYVGASVYNHLVGGAEVLGNSTSILVRNKFNLNEGIISSVKCTLDSAKDAVGDSFVGTGSLYLSN